MTRAGFEYILDKDTRAGAPGCPDFVGREALRAARPITLFTVQGGSFRRFQCIPGTGTLLYGYIHHTQWLPSGTVCQR